jgi:hypothetical protein
VTNRGTSEVMAHPALARLAIVYADEIRMRIVTEAHMREISPKLFYSECGGGSVSRVAQHFERLADAGWLTLSRTETGGSRRGAVEHFYRAAALAIFEDEVWAALPGSLRAAFSWVTFEQLTERVSAAIVAGSFNMRPDRHLSWTPVLVDEAGWKRLIAAADVVFRTVLEEQEQAKLRIADSGGESFLSTVALAIFESPMWLRHQGGEWRDRPYAPAQTTGVTATFRRSSFFPMLARVCSNPLDLQIIDELNRREMSPKLFHAEMPDVTLSGFDRRLKKLSEQGWAAEVRQKTGGDRRRAEHFYKAVGPALIDNESWAEIPDAIKATITSRTFEQFREKVKVAVDVGTFDSRIDRHLTWTLLRLDPIGWEKIISLVDGFFESLFDEEKGAKQRMARFGEKPILVTIGLAGFESPSEEVKAP